jgi:hypothetical protein
MIVVGGYTDYFGLTCLPEFLRGFNLSSGTWLESYDPAIWSNYSVPSAIRSVIGFTNPNLSSLFSEAYETSKITTYYPYATGTSNGLTPTPRAIPKYLGPVLGAVLGLLFLTALLVIWLWHRRRSRTREGPYSYTENDKMIDPLGGARGNPAVEIDGNGMHEAGGTTIHEMMGMSLTPSLFTCYLRSHPKFQKLIRSR